MIKGFLPCYKWIVRLLHADKTAPWFVLFHGFIQEIKGQECWVVRLVNPTQTGRYAQVRVWVHKKSQALIQVVGYNAGGRPLKRFTVTDVMKVGDAYTLRRMRVDTVDPVGNRVVGMTYLEFDKPKATGPRPGGLR